MRRLLRSSWLAAGLLIPCAASADWLVLRDGARLETRGPVRVEGRRVTFTNASGALVAIAASEVDLEATAAANREAAPGPASSPAAKPEPVLRLTDADVSHADELERPTILFYSTSWCGWCRKSRMLLDELEARYRERDVERDPGARRDKDLLAPGAGVPVIAFGDILLTGYSESGLRGMVDAWREAERAAQATHEESRRPVGQPRP